MLPGQLLALFVVMDCHQPLYCARPLPVHRGGFMGSAGTSGVTTSTAIHGALQAGAACPGLLCHQKPANGPGYTVLDALGNQAGAQQLGAG